mgnify:CR=1 FL=1
MCKDLSFGDWRPTPRGAVVVLMDWRDQGADVAQGCRIVFNRSTCSGIGLCEMHAPDYFEIADDGAGIDTGRTLWSYQADDNKAHTHTGTTDSDGAHFHRWSSNNRNYDSGGLSALNNPQAGNSGSDGNVTTTDGAHTHAFTTGSSGSESRPKNYAALVCIKYA